MTEESQHCSTSSNPNSGSDRNDRRPPARDLDGAGLERVLTGSGEPAYRARQVFKWLHQKRVGSFADMDNLPKTLRQKLESVLSCEKMPVVTVLESRTGDAVKFALQCADGAIIESVLLFDDRRRTLCISSQLGCALGCSFCRTATMGLVRNLSQSEILGQLVAANDYLCSRQDQLVTNIVFMGMGEALQNFEALRCSLVVIRSPDGFNLGGKKITVSTAGVVPSIERLMEEELGVNLAVSLNAHTNELRNTLMPINRRYPIEDLVATATAFYRRTGLRATFEYVVIDGVNNTPDAAVALGKLLRPCPCKVNLIPLNPGGADLPGPSEEAVDRFGRRLRDQDLTVTIRAGRGRDIDGACGQLAGRLNQENRP